MYFIFFFDLAPVLFTILILFFALIDQLAAMLPVLCVLFWILFAIYAVLNVILLCADDQHGIAEKIFIGMIMVVCNIFIGIVSNDFFSELLHEYGIGGINGLFGLIVTLIFGGGTWLLALAGLSYASMGPILADTDGKFIWSVIRSALILMLFMFIYL